MCGVFEVILKSKPPYPLSHNEIENERQVHASMSPLPQSLRELEEARQADIHSGAASFGELLSRV